MPYRPRYRRARGPTSYRTYSRITQNTPRARAFRLMANRMGLGRETAPEIKSIAVETAPTVVDVTGAIGEMNLSIVQGFASDERIGDDIFLRNLQIKGAWIANPGAVGTYLTPYFYHARIMVFWTDENWSALTVGNLTAGGFTAGIAGALQTWNMNDTSISNVTAQCLFDQQYQLRHNEGEPEVMYAPFEFNLPIRRRVMYDSLVNGSPNRGNLLLYLITDRGVGDNTLTITYKREQFWTDN